MLDLLHHIKLSYTRSTYTLAKAGPKKQEALKQEFVGLKNLLNGKIDHILFADESMIREVMVLGTALSHLLLEADSSHTK